MSTVQEIAHQETRVDPQSDVEISLPVDRSLLQLNKH